MKKKVLLTIASLQCGGAERQFMELVRGLSPRCEIVIVLFSEPNELYSRQLENLNANVVIIDKCKTGPLTIVRKLKKTIIEEEVDIIHAYLNYACVISVTAGRLAGVPVIASSVRDASADRGIPAIAMRYYTALLCDVLVSNSQAGIQAKFKRKWGKFHVVYNGVALERFDLNQDKVCETKSDLSSGGSKKVVAMVASLSDNKDHSTLLAAANNICDKRQDVVFYLVGDGPNRANILENIAKLQLEESVLLLGYSPEPEYILAASDVSVLLTNTDIHAEGLSNTIIESVFLGTPIIATKGGGTSEILDESIATLVDPFNVTDVASAITNILASPEIAARTAERAATKLRPIFDLNKHVDKYENLYDVTIGHPKARLH